jgi:hypothetical protein
LGGQTDAAFRACLFCFAAIGGMGRSALTWKWFNQIASSEMEALDGQLWWRFYESDPNFENFLIRALCYVGSETEYVAWGEDRVCFRDDTGELRYLPTDWTSLALPDPFVQASAGRSHFRIEDLFPTNDADCRAKTVAGTKTPAPG